MLYTEEHGEDVDEQRALIDPGAGGDGQDSLLGKVQEPGKNSEKVRDDD